MDWFLHEENIGMEKVDKMFPSGYHHNGCHNFPFQKYFAVYFTVQKIQVWINYY